MKHYKTLTWIQLKNTVGSINGNSKSKYTPILIIFLALCFLPTIFLLYQVFKAGFEMAILIQQSGFIFLVGFQFTALVIFIFSLFLIPSIYYFSKDINILLALPLSPQTIIASKFSVCLLYEYIFTAAIFIPMIFAYGQVAQISILMVVFIIIAFLTLPIYPLILSSILTMIMMRFAPFMKNRDRFNIIGSILLVMFAFLFSYYLSQMEALDANQIIALIQEGNHSLISIFSYLFPNLPYMAKTIINTDILSFIIYICILFVSMIIFILFAKNLYFKGVIGVDESTTSKKKLTKNAINHYIKRKPVLLTYIKKEYKLLIRTPVYLMNCFIMAFIPAFMVLTALFTSDISNFSELIPKGMLEAIITQSNFVWIILIAGIICGIACANLNLISATSISREGANYIFMKYIPVPLQTQINAKTLSGILISIFSILLFIIPIWFILKLPVYIVLLFIVCSSISCVLGNYLGILIDILHPKLIWEQEAAAVKQNITGVIALFGGVGIAVIIGFIASSLPDQMLPIYAIALVSICILLSILCYLYVNKIVIKIFAKL